MHLNKKVLIGLGTLAIAMLIIRPSWAATLLPLLLVAACPLTMMFMMRGTPNTHHQNGAPLNADDEAQDGPERADTDTTAVA